RRLLDARDHSRRSRRNRPAEDRERLIRRHGAIDVERAADHRAGAPAEKNAEWAAPAQYADEHPDQRPARHADELVVVDALGDAQLSLFRAFDDGRGLQSDAATG